ncbi:MAG: plasmid maintenance system killer protein [Wenzhouxiangella sp.]|nr:MAG: plasmid maintenance system killer protein [Wenzhouxiangella sp.]
MIKSWGSSSTRRFCEDGKCKFSGLDEEAAMDLLAVLDAATSLQDVSPLKSIGLHKLKDDRKGNRKGQWAITVNGPWRICFRFADGDAWDVEIVDYH